ncbi:hypothetical protein D3C72_2371140 [compost metagenome]
MDNPNSWVITWEMLLPRSPFIVATTSECPILYMKNPNKSKSPFLNLKSVNRINRDAPNIGNMATGR